MLDANSDTELFVEAARQVARRVLASPHEFEPHVVQFAQWVLEHLIADNGENGVRQS